LIINIKKLAQAQPYTLKKISSTVAAHKATICNEITQKNNRSVKMTWIISYKQQN